ncbi:quinoprotein relay system zinc metallohydrolase 2 [Thiorhodococcus minor]|nr:quinoprotein relay system zinc metallohydrolase 2 [Thiorhodococcus minor]
MRFLRPSRPWSPGLLLVIVAVVAMPGADLGPQPVEMREIAPGIFVREGAQAEISAQNGGHIANIGFIVGEACVAAIDTGSSLREGLALRAAVRQVTELPIAYLILTHVHPDHILGAAAFEQDGPEVIGHRMLPDAMARRARGYLTRIAEDLGPAAEGTEIVPPTAIVADTRRLDLGGRSLLLKAHPTAHTNNDLSVFDARTGTLWLSDLLFVDRIPALDGSILGWLRLCDALLESGAARVVPGHGPVPSDWQAALKAQCRYLQRIADGVRKVIQEGGTIGQAVAQVGREDAGNWLLFDAYHGRNVTAAFVELEWE